MKINKAIEKHKVLLYFTFLLINLGTLIFSISLFILILNSKVSGINIGGKTGLILSYVLMCLLLKYKFSTIILRSILYILILYISMYLVLNLLEDLIDNHTSLTYFVLSIVLITSWELSSFLVKIFKRDIKNSKS